MRLAFLISAHTDPAHLRRLVDSLPREADFYVHIDRKSDISQFARLLPDNRRVELIKHRTDVVWGSINEAEYQMELIRAALNDSRTYDYLISMSGMDYPLWSNGRIMEFFRECNGREILQGICMDGQGYAARNYVEYRLFSSRHWPDGSIGSKLRVALRKVIRRAGIRKPLRFKAGERTYKLYKGAAWWAITPRLAGLALREWDGNRSMRRYFNTSFCPAETFIQTVAFNSVEFAPRCILTEGEYTSLAALTPMTYIYYSPVVKVLTEDDFTTLTEQDKMFCRKTITGRSDRLMDMIDERRSEEEKRQPTKHKEQ